MNYLYNYGGILQCVALRNVLERMGHDVEVIRFSAVDRGKMYRKIKLLFSDLSCDIFYRYLLDMLINVFNCLFGKQSPLSTHLLDKCRMFIDENIGYTEPCNEDTIGRLILDHKMDVVVIGSDKIWGELARGQLVYMGDWKSQFKGKIISYAACSSFPFIPKFNKHKIHSLLNNFSAISVRDVYTRDLFKCYPDIDMKIVLDPAFLYDFAPYLEKKKDDPYVFVYILGREIEGGHKKIIEQIKRKYGDIKIKAVVLSNESTNIASYADEVICDADPSDWINMIYNASFIYTDSFHGIVFSLKFQKPFIAYYREVSRATRLIDLRNRMHLDHIIVSSVDEAIRKKSIESELDYRKINVELNKMKDSSLSFLMNSINA